MKNRMMFCFKIVPFMSLLAIPLMATISAAEGPDHEQGPPSHEMGKGPCGKLDLSESQKQQMTDDHFKFEEKKIDLEATTRHARLNFEKVASSEKSSEGDIRKAAEDLAGAENKLKTAEELFHADFFAKILKPEQRAEAMKCHQFGGPEHGPMDHCGKDH
jgi:Spy/CpxP family protein refolding chaperone